MIKDAKAFIVWELTVVQYNPVSNLVVANPPEDAVATILYPVGCAVIDL
jgi:hypothetical protein